jgi:hypothetical protein
MAAGQISWVNMAVRRCLLEYVGPLTRHLTSAPHSFRERFRDVHADTQLAIELCTSREALVWHRHRRTWRELRRTIYGYGIGVYAA